MWEHDGLDQTMRMSFVESVQQKVHFLELYVLYFKSISDDVQEMLQLWSTALPRHLRNVRCGTNKDNTDNTNSTYETTDAQTKNNNINRHITVY